MLRTTKGALVCVLQAAVLGAGHDWDLAQLVCGVIMRCIFIRLGCGLVSFTSKTFIGLVHVGVMRSESLLPCCSCIQRSGDVVGVNGFSTCQFPSPSSGCHKPSGGQQHGSTAW